MTTNIKNELQSKYFCESCDYITYKKCNYDKHQTSRKHYMTTAGLQKVAILVECDCGKSFKYRSGISRHHRQCSTEPVKDKKFIRTLLEENEMNMLRAQIAILMEQNTKLQENNARTTNNNTTNNITQNNTQNIYITVNNFGKENIEYITDKDICRLISMAPSKTIPKIIQMIHFDPEHPENHNVKMTNKKL